MFIWLNFKSSLYSSLSSCLIIMFLRIYITISTVLEALRIWPVANNLLLSSRTALAFIDDNRLDSASMTSLDCYVAC